MKFIYITELGSYFGVEGLQIYRVDSRSDGEYYEEDIVEVNRVGELGGETFLNTINHAFNTRFFMSDLGFYKDYI